MFDNKRIYAQSTEFYDKLCDLNKGFLNKIKQLVDVYPTYNLIPIICDYEKAYNNLEEIYKNNQDDEQVKNKRMKQEKLIWNASFTAPSTSNFNGAELQASTSAGSFKFVLDSASESVRSKESSTFGSDLIQQNKLEDYIDMIPCKVFVEIKDEQFDDYGTGKLYLTAIPNSDEVRLIVLDSLDILLYNFILLAGISIKRRGNKDVMLTILPTSDSKSPSLSVLFRVESSEEADQLLKTLEKHKK